MHTDHICIAVRSISKTTERICKVLEYVERTKPVLNSEQDVLVQFLSKAGSLDIKLIQPASPASPLLDFLKSKGEGLHHLCFKSDNVAEAINNMKERGARITSQPLPGEAFEDNLIAFAYVAGGLNVEIIDTDERRDLV